MTSGFYTHKNLKNNSGSGPSFASRSIVAGFLPREQLPDGARLRRRLQQQYSLSRDFSELDDSRQAKNLNYAVTLARTAAYH
jgi:hypothetical protein